jgi:phosphate transport system substrate-binding protein
MTSLDTVMAGEIEMKRTLLIASAIAMIATPAYSRDFIRIVGSTAVAPFTAAVAEEFSKSPGKVKPVVTSTGTNAGVKMFCGGVGENFPDFLNASRQLKKKELEECNAKGVTEVVEIRIGTDGLAFIFANDSALHSDGPVKFNLTVRQLFQALAKFVPDAEGNLVPNSYKLWSDIDPALPAVKIQFFGPAPRTGTHDSLLELVMLEGALSFRTLENLKEKDPEAFEPVWTSIREDGAYTEVPESEEAVKTLHANREAIAIFHYGFLDRHPEDLEGVPIDGAAASYDSIADGSYKITRPLYIYAKKQHLGITPGIAEFIAEYVSEKTMGSRGYLANLGLVALPARQQAKVRAVATDMVPLDGRKLK